MKKKLIEVALPLDAINKASAREKSIRHGHPSTLHLWWARRPLAAARAVIWSSLVDDPSSHPDRFPTEEAQEAERERLFGILEDLVVWENSNDERVLAAARAEIMASTDGNPPPILDPFSGGGTIPLEAQRLGLEALGGDLNPVAVLIGKAMVEIPPRFAGRPPVNPVTRADADLKTWDRAQGLADDVRYYGEWMRQRAWERIGHLYPTVPLPEEQGGGEGTVIAWIWARTVESPDPSWNGHVPLVRSWVVSKRPGKPVVWIDPVVDRDSQNISYRVREGGTPPEGTLARGARGTCVATGSAIEPKWIYSEGASDRFGTDLLTVVVEGQRGRVYMAPEGVEPILPSDRPDSPDAPLPNNPRWFSPPMYGMKTVGDLFTDRQLVALTTFSDLVAEARSEAERDALTAGMADDGVRLRDGGSGAAAYADAVATYLAFVVDKCADYWSTICTWHNSGEKMRNTFSRQAIPMTWDFAEANPFSDSTGNWMAMVDWVWKAIDGLPARGGGDMLQRDAASRVIDASGAVVSTDPPYYDNISYADLSDFFYVWLRRNLREVWPDELATVLTPKVEELIANPYRHGGRQEAFEHFETGMQTVFGEVAKHSSSDYPVTIFYAFKQEETTVSGRSSTGWETFLEGLMEAGLSITATWPVRTEMASRSIASGTAALASSIVLACRPRSADAPMATRSEFVAALNAELPDAVRLLQAEGIPPVDLAQSAIGPGMGVFSRYRRVVEADGSAMSVRTALALINEVLESTLSEEQTEFDADTRWALTWYEQFGLNPGSNGDAETLSKAKGTSVRGVVDSGIAARRGSDVWLVDRNELSDDWDPATDGRLTVWEVTQHLVRTLASSETAASELLRAVGLGLGERGRQLAYLLYAIANRRGWAKEAVAYNGLIVSWPEIVRLAQTTRTDGPTQASLMEEN